MRAFFDDDALAPGLQARFGGEVHPADMRDWVAFAREHLQPMEIGERIFVVPEWRDEATPTGRVRIEVNAGLAFGTGAHETTRLCLEAIERNICAQALRLWMLAPGSRILSRRRMKLGAGEYSACACDTDHGAVIVARRRISNERVSTMPVFVGSADSIAERHGRYRGGEHPARRGLRNWLVGMDANPEARWCGDSERLRGRRFGGGIGGDYEGRWTRCRRIRGARVADD